GWGQGIQKAKTSAIRLSGCDGRGKIPEKIIGNLLGGAVDETLAEMGELAADLCFHVVGEQRPTVLFRQCHRGAALCKARDPAVSLGGNLVTVGWVKVG